VAVLRLTALVVGAGVLMALAGPARAADRFAYIAGPGGMSVTPLDVATNVAGSPIGVENCPDAIAITPDGKTAYVGNQCSWSVTPVDTATNTAGASISVSDPPTSIAIAPDGKTAYVVASGVSSGVEAIDTATDTVTATIPVSSGSYIAITPDGKTAYVSRPDDFDVVPIDLTTNTAGPAIGVGTYPQQIAITPDGKTAYVPDYFDNDVTPIDIATNTAETPIPVGAGPNGIAITPDGKTAYVTDYSDGGVTPIDIATNTAGTPIPVGGGPKGIAITPDGKTAYVTDSGTDDVAPIDIATNTAGTAIPAGSGPVAIAIVPSQSPTAAFTAQPAAVEHDTSFDAAASSDFEGTITEYQWDFGDGSTDTSSSATVTHRYSTEGEYPVTLRVIDNECVDVTGVTSVGVASVGVASVGVASTRAEATAQTAQIFTGQTMSCNGPPTAEIEHKVLIANERGAPITAEPPTITGVRVQGQPPERALTGDVRVDAKLDCRQGKWADQPTGLHYQWNRDGVAIPGATNPTFTIQPSDQGHDLTCTTTAENAHGSATSISSPVDVSIASPALCPAPSGVLSGHRLGPVSLGEARDIVRARLPSYNLKALYTDDLCLSVGPGIRVGYGTATTLGPHAARSRLMGRILLALTANRFYALDGVRPGQRTASVKRRLRLSQALRVGANDWYVIHRPSGTGLLKVRHGVILEVGIVNPQLTNRSTGERQLLTNF
jgi:YVTN family beta-propeller protein